MTKSLDTYGLHFPICKLQVDLQLLKVEITLPSQKKRGHVEQKILNPNSFLFSLDPVVVRDPTHFTTATVLIATGSLFLLLGVSMLAIAAKMQATRLSKAELEQETPTKT